MDSAVTYELLRHADADPTLNTAGRQYLRNSSAERGPWAAPPLPRGVNDSQRVMVSSAQ